MKLSSPIDMTVASKMGANLVLNLAINIWQINFSFSLSLSLQKWKKM